MCWRIKMSNEFDKYMVHREYMGRLDCIYQMKDECIKNMYSLSDGIEKFSVIDSEVTDILENFKMANRTNLNLLKDIESASCDLYMIRQDINNTLSLRHDELLEEEYNLTLEEEAIQHEYRNWMLGLDSKENEDENEDKCY